MKNAWKETATLAWEARKQKKYYEELESTLFNKLKMLSNNKEKTSDGFIFRYTTRKGAIDYSIIPELQFVDLEEFRKDDIISWKLEKE